MKACSCRSVSGCFALGGREFPKLATESEPVFFGLHQHLHAGMDQFTYGRDLAVVPIHPLLDSCHDIYFVTFPDR
jgi:hypothetical protein